MQSTESLTQQPAGPTWRERQLVGGRYRLAAFHRRDQTTEVWRALDESTQQVVTLEFLRDREPATRARFVSEGKRMAAVEKPAVMRVAAVNDDDVEGTFVVYEHLIHVPVPLDWLRRPEDEAPAAPPPALAAPPEPAAPQPPVAPAPQAVQPAPEPVVPPPPQRPVMMIADPPSAAAAPVAPRVMTPPPVSFAEPAPLAAALPAADAPSEAESDDDEEHGLAALLVLLRAREFSLIDAALVKESALEVLSLLRQNLAEVRPQTILAAAGDVVTRVNPLAVVGSVTAPLRKISVPRPRAKAAAAGAESQVVHVKEPKAPKMKAVKVSEPKPMKEPKPARAPRSLHIRWRKVIFRGVAVGVLAASAALYPTIPPDVLATAADDLQTDATKVAQVVATTVGGIAQQVQSGIGKPGAATTPLAKASFDVPPLAAYGAAFEAQAEYPTVAPSSTVEWVVALRNTGSAGWYRGVEGAQASLALSDGTSAGVQTTAYVGPGEVGWFVVHFTAPAQPGTYRVALLPRIDGRGALPDLGLFATIVVKS